MRKLFTASLIFMSTIAAAKDFIIYDRMDYVGKPDLTKDKLSKVFLIYESDLVMPDPQGKRSHGVLNLPRIHELAKQAKNEGYKTISTDIESWFSNKDGQLLTPEVLNADFQQMFVIFKQENPQSMICNYGLPTENLSIIRYFRANADYPAVTAKWTEFNKRRKLATANCDYYNPVLYIAEPDIPSWERDVQTTVNEIRRNFPNKPIIGYLWPQYYSAKNSPYYKQFIDPKIWRQMLDISAKYMDGVIIWSDKRDENEKIVKWNDPRVQTMMQATKAFIAEKGKQIKVEGLMPSK